MLLAKNRKALFNNEVLQTFMAGIVLYGYEVKAIKEGKVSFEGAYINIQSGEAFLTNLYIGPYSKQNQDLPENQTKRPRKLLLNKAELNTISREIAQKGHTAVPIALLLKNSLIKCEIAIVKGRKKFEKKVVAKERQIKKDLEVVKKELLRN